MLDWRRWTLLVALAAASGVLLSGNSAKADPADETGTGFVAGRTGGLGVIQRHFEPGGLGWSVGGIAFYTNQWFLDAAAQGMITLDRTQWQRLYLVGGVSYTTNFAHPLGVGAGLGWELGGTRGVALSFELPLVLLYDLDKDWTLYPIPNVILTFNY